MFGINGFGQRNKKCTFVQNHKIFNMATLDVDSLRIELMRDILDTEDIDVLKTVKRTLTRALAKVKERQVVNEEEVEYISKQEILDGIRSGLNEFYQAKKAGKKLPDAEELLHGL